MNHFDTVFSLSCWDMHADGGGLNNTYVDYERFLCPQFDLAFTALLEDLEERGMLRRNGGGGAQRVRPHAATQRPRRPRPLPGGVDELPRRRQHPSGGQVIGATDKIGSRPHRHARSNRRRCSPRIYHGMGINLDTTMMPGPGDRPVRLVEAEPIPQLFK